MSVFYDLSKTPRNILNQAIVRAIVSENNGALFDPSDLSTLYQDAAGTIPVASVEQPVGKMLDKSGNGYHATQPITASRPVLSARYNLLTKTEDFTNAAWTKASSTVAANVTTSPFGDLTADLITQSGPGGRVTQQITSPADSITFNVFVKLASADNGARLLIYNNTTGVVVGTLIQSTLLTGGIDYGNGWRLYTLTVSSGISAGNAITAYIYTDMLGGAISGSSLYVFGADLRLGTTSGPYQRVNTNTDYDTDERYFKKYLRFDGVDDYLNLPYMGLYAGGSASVVAGLSTAAKGSPAFIVSEGNNANDVANYLLLIHISRGVYSSSARSDTGVTQYLLTSSTISTNNQLNVVTMVDGGGGVNLFNNSTGIGAASYARSSATTLNTTTIGALDRLTDTGFIINNLYGLIITKSALTDSQRVACERYLGRKSGVQL